MGFVHRAGLLLNPPPPRGGGRGGPKNRAQFFFRPSAVPKMVGGQKPALVCYLKTLATWTIVAAEGKQERRGSGRQKTAAEEGRGRGRGSGGYGAEERHGREVCSGAPPVGVMAEARPQHRLGVASWPPSWTGAMGAMGNLQILVPFSRSLPPPETRIRQCLLWSPPFVAFRAWGHSLSLGGFLGVRTRRAPDSRHSRRKEPGGRGPGRRAHHRGFGPNRTSAHRCITQSIGGAPRHKETLPGQ